MTSRYPEIEHNIKMVLNQRDAIEEPRRFFAHVHAPTARPTSCLCPWARCAAYLCWPPSPA